MKKQYLDIHKILFTNAKNYTIFGTKYPIETNEQGVRFVKFLDTEDKKEYEIVQQNPNTRSIYAARAKAGEKISWLIPLYAGFRRSDGWKVITDSTPVS